MSALWVVFVLAVVVVVCLRHQHIAERNNSCDKTPAKRRPRRAF